MYEKYRTDALVLRSYERGEADRVFALYTKGFGFVWARASAVRRESSRLRYALQNFSIANVSLVRGVVGWRIVGAHASVGVNSSCVATLARIVKLVERLVRGEEKNEYLFATLAGAHEALSSGQREALPAIELLAVVRVLYALGYVSSEAVGTAFFATTAFTHRELQAAEAERARLLSSVNKAISETQL